MPPMGRGPLPGLIYHQRVQSDEFLLRAVTATSFLTKRAEQACVVSEHNLWVVTFSDPIEFTPTGFRRTETLWHPKPFPNTQQPMWDFLAWTEYQPEQGATDSRTR